MYKTALKFLCSMSVIASFASVANAQTFRVATSLPEKHWYAERGFEAFMSCVKDGTSNEIEFDYFPGGTILKRDQGITGIQEHLAEITFVQIPDESARMPMQGLTLLPGIANSASELSQTFRKLYESGGLFTGEWEAAGVRPLALTALAPYQIASGRSVLIDGPDDFEGKKIRSTGSALNFLVESLGGLAIQMPAAEMYTAMQRGTVDGNVISFAGIKPYSLQEVMSAMSRNGSFGTVTQAIGIGEDAYAQLSPEQQKVFDDCGRNVETELTQWLDENDSAIADELADMGVNIFDFSPEDMEKLNESMSIVAEEFIARLTARDIPADKAYEELLAAIAD